jgi:hypothetical protein
MAFVVELVGVLLGTLSGFIEWYTDNLPERRLVRSIRDLSYNLWRYYSICSVLGFAARRAFTVILVLSQSARFELKH